MFKHSTGKLCKSPFIKLCNMTRKHGEMFGIQSLLPMYKVRNLSGKYKLQIIYLMYNMYQLSKTKSN